MLLNLREYHRPGDGGAEDGVAQALELLSRPMFAPCCWRAAMP